MRHLLLSLLLISLAACEGGSGTDETLPGGDSNLIEVKSVNGTWDFDNTATMHDSSTKIFSAIEKYLIIDGSDITMHLEGNEYANSGLPENSYCWIDQTLVWTEVGDEYYFDRDHPVIAGHHSPMFGLNTLGNSCSNSYIMDGSSYTVSNAKGIPKPYWTGTYNQWYLDPSDDDKLIWQMRHPSGWTMYMSFTRR